MYSAKQLLSALSQRKKYPTYEEMPTWMLLLLWASSSFVTSIGLYKMRQILPSYLELVDKIPLPNLGLAGFMVSCFVLGLVLLVCHHCFIATRCSSLLSKRLYQ